MATTPAGDSWAVVLRRRKDGVGLSSGATLSTPKSATGTLK
ncbi:hypothetical protein ACP70R_048090 [Stipagrostis hirtigluma subsp. patula]